MRGESYVRIEILQAICDLKKRANPMSSRAKAARFPAVCVRYEITGTKPAVIMENTSEDHVILSFSYTKGKTK